ncbi:MAG TPA: hypothetical protein VD913_02605 [bacterium]|nr:hypothetical protein [bacterium]
MDGRKMICLFFLCLLTWPLSHTLYAASEEIPVEEAAEPAPQPNRYEEYYDRVSDKFDSGTVNLLTGWSEVVGEAVDHYQAKKGFWEGLGHSFIGAGKGLVYGTLNTVGGAANLVTSPLPQFQFPLPRGGVNLQRMGVTA